MLGKEGTVFSGKEGAVFSGKEVTVCFEKRELHVSKSGAVC
jgi:hypothetical protein